MHTPPRILMTSAFAIFAAAMAGESAFGQKPEPKQLTFLKDNRAKATDHAAPVQILPDQEIHLLLPANAGTGATWKVKDGSDLLKLESKPGGDIPKKKAGPGEAPRFGESQDRIFRFRPLKKGTGKLKMVLTLPDGEEGLVFLAPFEIK